MIPRGSDRVFSSTALTDGNGDPLTSGSVKLALLNVLAKNYDADSIPSSFVYMPATAMTHTAGGVWDKTVLASVFDRDNIPLSVGHLLVRITIHDGSDVVVATFDLVEELTDVNVPTDPYELRLALIQARIDGRLLAGKDVESFGAIGHSVALIPVRDLMKMEAITQARVDRRKRGGMRTHKVRF